MRHLCNFWLLFCLSASCIAPSPLVARESATEKPAEESGTKNEADTEQPKTYTVTLEPFRSEVELKGLFEARRTGEVILRPKTWSKFSVRRAVRHGATVKKGQPLIWLDTEEIDEKIRSVKHDIEAAKISRQTSEAELETLAKSLPLDMKAAANANEVADDALRFHNKIGSDNPSTTQNSR